MSVIHGRGFLAWLLKAGLVPENTRKVVIVADYRSPVIIHAEVYGNAEMLTVDPVEVLGTDVRVHETPRGNDA